MDSPNTHNIFTWTLLIRTTLHFKHANYVADKYEERIHANYMADKYADKEYTQITWRTNMRIHLYNSLLFLRVV